MAPLNGSSREEKRSIFTHIRAENVASRWLGPLVLVSIGPIPKFRVSVRAILVSLLIIQGGVLISIERLNAMPAGMALALQLALFALSIVVSQWIAELNTADAVRSTLEPRARSAVRRTVSIARLVRRARTAQEVALDSISATGKRVSSSDVRAALAGSAELLDATNELTNDAVLDWGDAVGMDVIKDALQSRAEEK